VRTADDPDRAVARFFPTTYQAAADLGHWDRDALEDDPNHLPPQSPAEASMRIALIGPEVGQLLRATPNRIQRCHRGQ
jgi:hypothetical protein